jgi:hypothetical protein
VTHPADPSVPQTAPALPDVALPETDDPVVLRELLRQAREHLRLRASIEQVMAENTARTEALLLDARTTPAIDREALAGAVADLRASLAAALAATDRLASLTGGSQPIPSPRSGDDPPARFVTPDGERRTVEVLVHEIHAPGLARSLQQHLAGLDGIERAEVRELAEGLLRITVDATVPLDGDALAGWEPQRGRTVRTARPDVLEIELVPTGA